MTAVGDGRNQEDGEGDPVDLPERIIVVREPVDPEGGAAPVAAELPGWEPPAFDVVPLVSTDAGAARDRHEAAAARAATEAIDLDEVDLRAEPDAPDDLEELDELDQGERDALVAQVAASQADVDDAEAEADDDGPPTEAFPWDESDEGVDTWRDETGPGTLRPTVPEPVIAARTTSSSSWSRRSASRLRALIGLLLVVVMAGIGLAAAIGATMLVVVLVLSRAFGSGG